MSPAAMLPALLSLWNQQWTGLYVPMLLRKQRFVSKLISWLIIHECEHEPKKPSKLSTAFVSWWLVCNTFVYLISLVKHSFTSIYVFPAFATSIISRCHHKYLIATLIFWDNCTSRSSKTQMSELPSLEALVKRVPHLCKHFLVQHTGVRQGQHLLPN